MAINIGARRGAKNQRRKVVVAEKRKAELEANTTAGRVRQTLAWPIQHCLVSEGLFGVGMGVVMIARGETPAGMSTATFLLDMFGAGVKDVFFRPTSGGQFADDLRHMSGGSPMVPADPAYARKLLRDLVAWARGLGFPPHRDFAKIEAIFGSVKAENCDVRFEFGHGGRPSFIGEERDAEKYVARVAARKAGGEITGKVGDALAAAEPVTIESGAEALPAEDNAR